MLLLDSDNAVVIAMVISAGICAVLGILGLDPAIARGLMMRQSAIAFAIFAMLSMVFIEYFLDGDICHLLLPSVSARVLMCLVTAFIFMAAWRLLDGQLVRLDPEFQRLASSQQRKAELHGALQSLASGMCDVVCMLDNDLCFCDPSTVTRDFFTPPRFWSDSRSNKPLSQRSILEFMPVPCDCACFRRLFDRAVDENAEPAVFAACAPHVKIQPEGAEEAISVQIFHKAINDRAAADPTYLVGLSVIEKTGAKCSQTRGPQLVPWPPSWTWQQNEEEEEEEEPHATGSSLESWPRDLVAAPRPDRSQAEQQQQREGADLPATDNEEEATAVLQQDEAEVAHGQQQEAEPRVGEFRSEPLNVTAQAESET